MDKIEILKKAQNKKAPDEMELQIAQKSGAISNFAILVLALILMIVKMFMDQPWHDVYSFMFVSMSASHLYKGIRLKEKHEIIWGIVFGICSLVSVGLAIYEYISM